MNKLLFTGASGFLGYNILPILHKEYETVHTMGLGQEDDIKINLAKEVPPINTHYDIVLHACGKAHVVPRTPEEEKAFYDVNYEGTRNLCAALEKVGVPKALVFISTVAVYGCESGELISEDYPLNGDTPYAKSKIMAEEFLTAWCRENGVVLGILRPSLLAGKNAPVKIGKNCWLGEGVIVMPGVTIGDGCVIGAHSVVNKDIPPASIAVGCPACVIKQFNYKTDRWEKV